MLKIGFIPQRLLFLQILSHSVKVNYTACYDDLIFLKGSHDVQFRWCLWVTTGSLDLFWVEIANLKKKIRSIWNNSVIDAYPRNVDRLLGFSLNVVNIGFGRSCLCELSFWFLKYVKVLFNKASNISLRSSEKIDMSQKLWVWDVSEEKQLRKSHIVLLLLLVQTLVHSFILSAWYVESNSFKTNC